MTTEPPRNNLAGGAWLIADMSLNIWALSIVKWLDGAYPAAQIVFLRAALGLVLITPLIWRRRAAFRDVDHKGLHAVRVGLSVITLSASFYAISRVPLALFTAMNFTRPVVTMVLAALVLRETIGRRRWVAAGVAFLGVWLAMSPKDADWNLGLLALAVVVCTGSAAIIATRRLRHAPPTVLMTLYTAGLALCTAPFAMAYWTAIDPAHIGLLLAVGGFAQGAQLCFLRAHYHGEAGFLSVLGYLSLVLSVGTGVVVFGEVPTSAFVMGACLVIAAALWVALRPAAAGPAQGVGTQTSRLR